MYNRLKPLWLIGLIIASILTGCAAPDEHPFISEEFDWCYIFNLNEENGFAINNGTRNGEGITSDSDGVLIFSYGYDRNVYARVAYVTVLRPFDVEGDITIKATGRAFGVLAETYGATLPAAMDSARLEFREDAYNENLLSRDSISVHAEAQDGQRISIAQIEVRGDGANPFPRTTCNGTATPTPTPPGTPFGTGTPTITPSPTPTGTWESPTPSATPTSEDWICTYEGTSLETQISAYFGGAAWTGTGWTSNPSSTNRINIQGNVTGRYIYSITVFMTSPPGGDANVIRLHDMGNPAYRAQIEASEVTFIPVGGLLGAWYFDVISNWSGSGAPISGEVYKLTFAGTGEEIPGTDCDEPTPTPAATNTPGPSPTMGPTGTFEPLWRSCVDFLYSEYQFVSEGASYEDGEGFVQEDDVWSVGRGSFGTTAKKKIKLSFAPGQTFTGDVRLTDNASNATDWNTVSGNTIITDFSGDAWSPTNTFWVEFDGNNVPLTLQSICWLDPNPSTVTPGPGTGTPIGTRTPLFDGITPTSSATARPTIMFPITSTPGVYITQTRTGGSGGTATPGATITPGGTGGDGTPEGSGDAGDLLGVVWSIGYGLLQTGSAYMQEGANLGIGMLNGMVNAPPQGIPGLPQCITNPMAHDICAIYYILDFTLLAPGTPGQLIIPFVMAILNFFTVIRFLRWIWKFVRRSEDVTHAQ